MDNRLFLLLTLGLLGALAAAPSSMAHEPASEPPLIVIDTDLGLDDVATLTLVLQSPQVHLRAVVACDGACNGRKCADFLRRLLCEFNRPDVILYEPASGDNLADPPPFRSFLQESLQMALPHIVAHHSSTFVPEAYAVRGPKTIVLVLGPLTNLAAALRADPGIKAAISKVIIPGWPDVNRNWNIRYDPESYEVVRRAGMQLVFVAPDEAVAQYGYRRTVSPTSAQAGPGS